MKIETVYGNSLSIKVLCISQSTPLTGWGSWQQIPFWTPWPCGTEHDWKWEDSHRIMEYHTIKYFIIILTIRCILCILVVIYWILFEWVCVSINMWNLFINLKKIVNKLIKFYTEFILKWELIKVASYWIHWQCFRCRRTVIFISIWQLFTLHKRFHNNVKDSFFFCLENEVLPVREPVLL